MHNKLMRNASFAHMLSVYLESSTHSPWGSFTLRSLLADFEKLENRSCTDQEFAQASHQICQNLICLIWTSSDQEAKDFPELLPVYKKYGELLRTETHRSFREAAGLPPDDGTIEWCEMCFYQQDRPEMTRELTDLRIRAINSVTKPFYRRLYPDSYQSPFTY